MTGFSEMVAGRQADSSLIENQNRAFYFQTVRLTDRSSLEDTMDGPNSNFGGFCNFFDCA